MAPAWLSSLWRSGASPEAGLTNPSLGQILSSKRVRYTATALVALVLFMVAFRHYDQLPTLESLRQAGSSLGSSLDRPKFDCPPATVPSYKDGDVDWSQFAYTQYVTNREYLCNSVMIFETLHRLKSRADRVMMYPDNFLDAAATTSDTEEGKLLIKARDEYEVKLVPVAVQRRLGGDSTWAESFTKLLAFNQTQYKRVLNVDSDSTILQTMDELFLMPPCPVAMPRAYWLFPNDKKLSSQLMLVQPSAVEFDRVQKKVEASSLDDYDMEIVNQLYMDQAMILPHRPYDLLTGEFRGDGTHEWYLGTDREAWDPVAVFNEGKFLHFSDWPVPKPWIPMGEGLREAHQPKCVQKDGKEDCTAREMWNGFYKDFADRRARVCSTSGRRRQAVEPDPGGASS